MHARHVTVHGSPDRVDEGIRSVRESVLPIPRECAGFKGQLLMVDRDKGEVIGSSVMGHRGEQASEEKVLPVRQETADQVEAFQLRMWLSTSCRFRDALKPSRPGISFCAGPDRTWGMPPTVRRRSDPTLGR